MKKSGLWIQKYFCTMRQSSASRQRILTEVLSWAMAGKGPTGSVYTNLPAIFFQSEPNRKKGRILGVDYSVATDFDDEVDSVRERVPA